MLVLAAALNHLELVVDLEERYLAVDVIDGEADRVVRDDSAQAELDALPDGVVDDLAAVVDLADDAVLRARCIVLLAVHHRLAELRVLVLFLDQRFEGPVNRFVGCDGPPDSDEMLRQERLEPLPHRHLLRAGAQGLLEQHPVDVPALEPDPWHGLCVPPPADSLASHLLFQSQVVEDVTHWWRLPHHVQRLRGLILQRRDFRDNNRFLEDRWHTLQF